MNGMYELEWLIGAGVAALIVGLLVGLALGRTLFRSSKTKVLEQELETAEAALRDYRAEVYDQFAETARKFEKLNDSYHDLHRHLASSANTLLGDGISTPLLRGPVTDADGASLTPDSDSEATTESTTEPTAEPTAESTTETPTEPDPNSTQQAEPNATIDGGEVDNAEVKSADVECADSQSSTESSDSASDKSKQEPT